MSHRSQCSDCSSRTCRCSHRRHRRCRSPSPRRCHTRCYAPPAPSCSPCNPALQCIQAINANLVAGNIPAVIAAFQPTTGTLTYVDQSGVLPYGGTYTGTAGVAQFFTLLGTYAPSTLSVVSTAVDCSDPNTVITRLAANTTLRCPSTGATAGPYAGLVTVIYSTFIPGTCTIQSSTILADNTVSAIFFATCPVPVTGSAAARRKP